MCFLEKSYEKQSLNFENYETALYSKLGIIPLIVFLNFNAITINELLRRFAIFSKFQL